MSDDIVVSSPFIKLVSKKINNHEYEFNLKLKIPNACSICEEKFDDVEKVFDCLSNLCSESHKHNSITTCFTDLRAMQMFLQDPTMHSYTLFCRSCAEKMLEEQASKVQNYDLKGFCDGHTYLVCPFCRLADYSPYKTKKEKQFVYFYEESELFSVDSVTTTANHYKDVKKFVPKVKQNDDNSDDESYYSDYDCYSDYYSEEDNEFHEKKGIINLTKLLDKVSVECGKRLIDLQKNAVVKYFSPQFFCPVTGCNRVERQLKSYEEILQLHRYEDVKHYRGMEMHTIDCEDHGIHCVHCQKPLTADMLKNHGKICVGVPDEVALVNYEVDFKKCPGCFVPVLAPFECNSVTCDNCITKFKWPQARKFKIRKTKKLVAQKKELQRLEAQKRKEEQEKIEQDLAQFQDVADDEETQTTKPRSLFSKFFQKTQQK